MWLHVSVIISQLFKVITLAKYVLSILELNDAQREHLKMSLSVSSIISQLFKVIILANNSCKCVLSILKLNWNERLREKTKLEICGQELRQVVHKTAKQVIFATSWKERERLRNVQKWKMHVQSVQNYCFSSLNTQICDVLVTFVFVVA